MRNEGMFPHRVVGNHWDRVCRALLEFHPGECPNNVGVALGSVVTMVVWLDLGTLNDSIIPWISLLLQEEGLVSSPLELPAECRLNSLCSPWNPSRTKREETTLAVPTGLLELQPQARHPVLPEVAPQALISLFLSPGNSPKPSLQSSSSSGVASLCPARAGHCPEVVGTPGTVWGCGH